MALRTFCDHCAKECTGVAYRLDAVHADAPAEALRRSAYLHWECVPSYQRGEEKPGAYHLYDTGRGVWSLRLGWTRLRSEAHPFSGADASSLSAVNTNLAIIACKPECGHSGQ